MNKWKTRRSQFSSISSSTVLTARMFLGKDGHTPYLTSQQIFNFNDHARIEDIEYLEHVIDLGRHYRITSCRKSKNPDKSGNHYLWPVFNRNGNPDGGKVLNIGNLYQFINDLYDNKFTIGFTYDELIEEAEQA